MNGFRKGGDRPSSCKGWAFEEGWIDQWGITAPIRSRSDLCERWHCTGRKANDAPARMSVRTPAAASVIAGPGLWTHEAGRPRRAAQVRTPVVTQTRHAAANARIPRKPRLARRYRDCLQSYDC
jgi:hypothetical protein